MTIETIHLRGVVPDIFNDQPTESDVWRVDCDFRRGHDYMIEADSGTGKSSLCSYIYGNRADYQGQILFDDTDIRRFSPADWCQLRRTSIAILPQDMRLFPELTAMDNIQLKNRLTHHLTEAEIRDMLALLGIADKADTLCSRMSIGQQQRVAIVRALCQPFSFLLLDEPVSHLDERNNAIAASLIQDHARRQGAAIIATSVGNPLHLSTKPQTLKM